MLSVRIQGQKYRIGNETLDRLLGAEIWRRLDSGLLQKRIQDEYLAGRLIERRVIGCAWPPPPKRPSVGSAQKTTRARFFAGASCTLLLRWRRWQNSSALCMTPSNSTPMQQPCASLEILRT